MLRASKRRGFRVNAGHFVKRHGLIIIALNESIVAIGVGAAGLGLGAGIVLAAVLIGVLRVRGGGESHLRMVAS